MNLSVELMQGRRDFPRLGQVVEVNRAHPPYAMLGTAGAEVEPVTAFLRDLALGDCSPPTCRSYCFGMLRWFRLMWLLGIDWERATEAEVVVLTGWLRSAVTPQRQRHRADRPVAGTVNVRTCKPSLAAGYAPRTINHALTVISGFYDFHAHQGQGPVVNPVPHSAQRRRALGHRSPLEPTPRVGRARMRQRVPDRPPRAEAGFECPGAGVKAAEVAFFLGFVVGGGGDENGAGARRGTSSCSWGVQEGCRRAAAPPDSRGGRADVLSVRGRGGGNRPCRSRGMRP